MVDTCTQAVDREATIAYVLPPGTSCALPTPPSSAIGRWLIPRARQTSLDWIDSGEIDLPDPEQFLAHHHREHPGSRTPRSEVH